MTAASNVQVVNSLGKSENEMCEVSGGDEIKVENTGLKFDFSESENVVKIFDVD